MTQHFVWDQARVRCTEISAFLTVLASTPIIRQQSSGPFINLKGTFAASFRTCKMG